MLFPADLLELPRQPTKDFPPDPYVASDARAKSIEAAKKRAQAYLDGSVRKEAKGFAVALKLRSPDGAEIGAASGDGATIYEATGAAAESLAATGALPNKTEIDPEVANWLSVRHVDTQLLIEAIVGKWSELEAPCQKLYAVREELVHANWAVRECSDVLPAWYRDLPPAEVDASTPWYLANTVTDVALRAPTADLEGALVELTRQNERETCSWAKNWNQSALGLIWSLKKDSDRESAATLAMVAATPSDLDAWSRVVSSARDALRVDGWNAFTGWIPSRAEAWAQRSEDETDLPAQRRLMRRAVAVQASTDYRIPMARISLRAGDPAEARALASSMGDDTEEHRVGRAYLLGRIDALEGRFGIAFDNMSKALLSAQQLDSEGESAAFYTELVMGRLLGRGKDWADGMAQRWIMDVPEDDICSITARRSSSSCASRRANR